MAGTSPAMTERSPAVTRSQTVTRSPAVMPNATLAAARPPVVPAKDPSAATRLRPMIRALLLVRRGGRGRSRQRPGGLGPGRLRRAAGPGRDRLLCRGLLRQQRHLGEAAVGDRAHHLHDPAI